jgi:nucleoside-diphosphate-sugar epimerase
MTTSRKGTCVLTGAGGFVGSRLKERLEQEGWQVVPWTRSPRAGTESVEFHLGQEIAPERLKGVRALVHCAYDFGPRTWEQIKVINVDGSEKLLRAAHAARVETIVFISSLSAFAGCRSLYGRAKLDIEKLAESAGAVVLRPGLVYGVAAGGMFGGLVAQVEQARIIPLPTGGQQTQYLLHEEDLARVVLGCLEGRVRSGTGPIAVAHERGWEMRELLSEMGRALGKRVSFLPLPWQLPWLGLKALELAGVRTAFRSDSLVSLAHQNPNPSFALLKSLGFECRPFEASAVIRNNALNRG